jgi:preprotein translocase subunit Sss1
MKYVPGDALFLLVSMMEKILNYTIICRTVQGQNHYKRVLLMSVKPIDAEFGFIAVLS